MEQTAAVSSPRTALPQRSQFVELELARAREQRRRQEERVFAQLRSLQAASEQRAALQEKQRGGTSDEQPPGGVDGEDASADDHRLMMPARSLGQADGQLLDLGLGQMAFGRHGGNDGLVLNLDLLGLGQRHHIRRWLVEQNHVTQVINLIESAPPQTRHALTALLERLLCGEPDAVVGTGGALRLRLGGGDATEIVALEMDPPSPALLKLELTPRANGSRESVARSSPSVDVEEADSPLIAKGGGDVGDGERAGEADQGALV